MRQPLCIVIFLLDRHFLTLSKGRRSFRALLILADFHLCVSRNFIEVPELFLSKALAESLLRIHRRDGFLSLYLVRLLHFCRRPHTPSICNNSILAEDNSTIAFHASLALHNLLVATRNLKGEITRKLVGLVPRGPFFLVWWLFPFRRLFGTVNGRATESVYSVIEIGFFISLKLCWRYVRAQVDAL